MNDQIIKDLVASRVKRGDLFTAYDVSKDVQQRGVRAGHRKDGLRDITHKLFADGEMDGYDRTLVDLGNGLQAWVYHPQSADPYTYKSKHLSGVAPTATQAQTQTKAAPAINALTAIDGVLDCEDRLNIPVEFFQAIGLNAHNDFEMEFYEDADAILIDKVNPTSSNSNREVASVTAKGNYRLCQRLRNQVGAFVGKTDFKIEILLRTRGPAIKISLA